MNVGVKDRLPCGFPTIHADVEALWVEPLLEEILNVPDEIESVRVFPVRHFPDRRDMSLWNYESMTRRHGEAVEERTRQVGLSQQRTIKLAKDTFHPGAHMEAA
jgi:hypothetical protein